MGFNISKRTSDNYRLIRSHPLNAPLADGTYTLFYVPYKAFVGPLWANVSVGTDLADLTVGFFGNKMTADPDGIMSAAELASDTAGNKVQAAGFWFNQAKGAITVTLPTAITTGNIIFFARYSVIH